MELGDTSDSDLTWYVKILVVFVLSGLMLALTDRLSGEAASRRRLTMPSNLAAIAARNYRLGTY
jgi:hypothetical protein